MLTLFSLLVLLSSPIPLPPSTHSPSLIHPLPGLLAAHACSLRSTSDAQTDTENYSRNCFLRFAPEMNGDWNPYGLQPLAFVQAWQQMYTTVKAITPNTAIVWAPNTGQG